ncbi:MAG TPA: S1/P1 nuclease [Longimicrobium sp.]|nr:S1/P1 nuclease [Longimicrobium sp.]
MKRLMAALVAVFVLSSPAYAWDELGHRVVARIAWDNMTPAARAASIRLLEAAPPASGIANLMPRDARPLEERQRDWFVDAAVWADIIRSRNATGNRYAHADWHYVNFFWEQRPNGARVDRDDMPRAGGLLTELTRIGGILGDASRPDSARAIDLVWALHLVGDAHQPLHNSARITAEHPDGDRGGNLYELRGLYPNNNLHAFWDGIVAPAFPWQAGSRTESDYVGSIAARIEARQPQRALANRLFPGDYERWSREGLRVAQTVAYTTPEHRTPTRSYLFRAWDAAEPRVALAGYRLAALLNRALGS